MHKSVLIFSFLLLCFSIPAFGQVQTAQTSVHKSSAKTNRAKPHNSIFFTIERVKTDELKIDIAFHSAEGKFTVGEGEISVQLLSVKRTADGKVDDVIKVGMPTKADMPAVQVDAAGGDKTGPTITVRLVAGADAMSVSVKDFASGAVKQVLLRVPPGEGTTMGELRF